MDGQIENIGDVVHFSLWKETTSIITCIVASIDIKNDEVKLKVLDGDDFIQLNLLEAKYTLFREKTKAQKLITKELEDKEHLLKCLFKKWSRDIDHEEKHMVKNVIEKQFKVNLDNPTKIQ